MQVITYMLHQQQYSRISLEKLHKRADNDAMFKLLSI